MNTKSRKGFSLVELIITVVIIGVLTAVAVPIYKRSVQNTRRSEADASLGTIKNQLRVYYTSTGSYPLVNPAGYVIGASWNDIAVGDLDGTYFTDSSNLYESRDGLRFTLTCRGGGVLDHDRTMDESGNLAES